MQGFLVLNKKSPLDFKIFGGLCLNLRDLSLKDLERERNTILKDIEEQWRQRSRAIWIQSGDLNTKFFHSFASYRRNHKFIWELQDEEGTVHRGQENLKLAAANYFKDFYNKQDGY
jgi:hypothetical protein